MSVVEYYKRAVDYNCILDSNLVGTVDTVDCIVNTVDCTADLDTYFKINCKYLIKKIHNAENRISKKIRRQIDDLAQNT